MELEDKIFKLVFRAIGDETGDFNATDCARAILAIPEIAEALANRSSAKFAYTRGLEDGQDANA